MTTAILALLTVLTFALPALGKAVRYELTAENRPLQVTGEEEVDFAITVNGGIPAPTLEFTEGDEAIVVVHNQLPREELSIHWHGLLLPPEMDGVPYVNTPPILPGKSHTFRFKLRQHGTYWYHSHTAVQEQKGVYGAFIIHPKKRELTYDKEGVVVISDWTNENPDQVLENLRKDGDYYTHKKDTMRSYWGAIKAGGLKSHLLNEWARMGGMDLSDVGYDAFLINGRPSVQLLEAHPGERIRLRVINASASSYFYVSLAGLPMKVIAADGTDIVPVSADEILIGTAETYDVLFTVPAHKNYELRATAQDVTGFASAWIGMGEKVSAPSKPSPDLYAAMEMNDGDHANHMSGGSPAQKGHEGHGAAPLRPTDEPTRMTVATLTTDNLRSPIVTTLPKDAPVRELRFVLGGDMERYVWHIDGKTIAQEYKVTIKEGEVVRMTFVNDTMMHHPFHLHGHFFRVLNRHGGRSPLKHTVDIPPHGSRTIEFYANEPGDWMLHCHNLYHLKSGMARVVSYASYTPSAEIQELQKKDPHLHDHLYYDGRVELATNHAEANLRAQRTWDSLEARLETREYDPVEEFEGDLLYRRWFGRFFNLIAGASYFDGFEQEPIRGVLGIGYILPFLVEADLLVDHQGKSRLDLERRFQWTKYVFSDAEVTFRQSEKTEFEISIMYANSWAWAAGVMFTEDSVGLGAEYKF